MFNSHSDAYITTTIDGYNFPIFGSGDGNLNYTENQVTIEESQRLVGPLNPDGSVLKYNDDMEPVSSRNIKNINNAINKFDINILLRYKDKNKKME